MGLHPDTITVASLCTGGLAGLDVVGRWLGWRTVLYCEIDPYRQANIQARIGDGLLDDAPIWDNARTLDWKPWRGLLDGLLAGFPCQPHSVAGQRRGAADERDLWPEVARALREARPAFCFLENVGGLGLRKGEQEAYAWSILADLAALGYVGSAGIVAASDAGAPHRRERLFFVAYDESALADSDIGGGTKQKGQRQAVEWAEYSVRSRRERTELADSSSRRGHLGLRGDGIWSEPSPGGETDASTSLDEPKGEGWLACWTGNGKQTPLTQSELSSGEFPWPARYGKTQHPWEPPRTVESRLGMYADGLPAWLVERIRKAQVSALGDGVVPQQALMAWYTLTGGVL